GLAAQRGEEGAVEALGGGEVGDGEGDVVEHPAEAAVAGMLELATLARPPASSDAALLDDYPPGTIAPLRACPGSPPAPGPRLPATPPSSTTTFVGRPRPSSRYASLAHSRPTRHL